MATVATRPETKHRVQAKSERIHLTPTGLLMEGDYTHHPIPSPSRQDLPGCNQPLNRFRFWMPFKSAIFVSLPVEVFDTWAAQE
jgi:hypothetical protein